MTSSELIPAAVLNRKAVVYVRQSTQSQVMTNLESQRRQYDLVEVAGDAPSFVEMARAVVAIGVIRRLLVACQDHEYLFAQIER